MVALIKIGHTNRLNLRSIQMIVWTSHRQSPGASLEMIFSAFSAPKIGQELGMPEKIKYLAIDYSISKT